jgi:hypothetical protein
LQVRAHEVPSQVAMPLGAVGHAVQLVPHELVLVSATH